MKTSWIGVAAVFALLAGVAVWVSETHAPSAPPSRTAAGDLDMPADSESIVEQALAQVPVDSTELRNRWLDTVPGLNVSMLSAAQRERLVRVANSRRCTCGCGFTVATCRAFDATCPVSGPYVEELRDSVRRNLIPAAGLRRRPT